MTTWEPIGQTPHALILYDPSSHALSVQRRPRPGGGAGGGGGGGGGGLIRTRPRGGDVQGPSTGEIVRRSPDASEVQQLARTRRGGQAGHGDEPVDLCPYCYQALPEGYGSGSGVPGGGGAGTADAHDPFAFSAGSTDRPTLAVERSADPSAQPHPLLPSPDLQRTPPYFRILERAHDAASRPSTPGSTRITPLSASSSRTDLRATAPLESDSPGVDGDSRQSATPAPAPRPQAERNPPRGVEGYYTRFFVEERRLGMGAEGSVYLCQHVLEGNPLGHYAVKKVAVGESSPYLFKMLREVRLLEALRHPNIIPYHHVWIETTRFSS